MSTTTDKKIVLWEKQITDSDNIKELVQSEGWKVMVNHLKEIHETKILDSFRRIPADSKHDVGFRILQGEYQMLYQIFRVPFEIIEIGEQAKRNIEKTEAK